MALGLIFLGILLYLKPFTAKKDQIFNVVLEVLILLLNTLILITALILKDKDPEDDLIETMGWVLTGVTIAVFLAF